MKCASLEVAALMQSLTMGSVSYLWDSVGTKFKQCMSYNQILET